jgi:centrin-3
MNEFDREQTGKIEYADYIEISIKNINLIKKKKVSKKYSDRDPEDEIIKAFKLFDDDNSGKISLRKLKKISKELGEALGDEEL